MKTSVMQHLAICAILWSYFSLLGRSVAWGWDWNNPGIPKLPGVYYILPFCVVWTPLWLQYWQKGCLCQGLETTIKLSHSHYDYQTPGQWKVVINKLIKMMLNFLTLCLSCRFLFLTALALWVTLLPHSSRISVSILSFGAGCLCSTWDNMGFLH